jgi:hypothetical protein
MCFLADDDTFLDTDVSSKLGTIKLEIWAAAKTDQVGLCGEPPEQQKVHEQIKKVTTHCVKYMPCALYPPFHTHEPGIDLVKRFGALHDGSRLCRASVRNHWRHSCSSTSHEACTALFVHKVIAHICPTELLIADGIIQSSIGKKRRAIAEPEVHVKDEIIEIDNDSDTTLRVSLGQMLIHILIAD